MNDSEHFARSQPRWLDSNGASSHGCEEPGCLRPTREGKPYCLEHVGRLPYVRDLTRALEARLSEEARVARLGPDAVDPSGLTASELLLVLDQSGPSTLERLSRVVGLEPDVTASYVEVFARLGWVHCVRTQRGAIAVHRVRPSAAAQPCAEESEPALRATG